jgi:hypothetical protein
MMVARKRGRGQTVSRAGAMGYWSNGVMGKETIYLFYSTPIFQYSNTPVSLPSALVGLARLIE